MEIVSATQHTGYVTNFFLYGVGVVCLLIVTTFYSHRLLARCVTVGLRLWLWNSSCIYISIESVKLSLLGGRLLFKKFTYQSTNQRVSAVHGHLSLRFWDSSRRGLHHDPVSASEKGRKSSDQSSLPPLAPLGLNLFGVEWVIYNRTPAYDYVADILSSLSKDDGGAKSEPVVDISPISDSSSSSLLLRLMPIDVDIQRGSLIIGSVTLPTLLSLDIRSARGSYSSSPSRSIYDRGKYSLALTLARPKLQLRSNPTQVKDPQYSFHATRSLTLWERFTDVFRTRSLSSYRRRQESKGKTREGIPPSESSETTWSGLRRYTKQRHEFTTDLLLVEYAKVTNLVECHELSINYFADDAGRVPNSKPPYANADPYVAANGDLSPEWGVDLKFRDSVINYGPWADKERVDLQRFFFPYACRSYPATALPQVNGLRIFTAMAIHVDFVGDVTWRIPFKEHSKDWQYKFSNSHPDLSVPSSTSRDYGWVDLKFPKGTSLQVVVPMVYGDQGSCLTVDVRASGVDVVSSVNLTPFVMTSAFTVSCRMPSPRIWNLKRVWKFEISFGQPKIYLLRDHVSLGLDLIADWNDRAAVSFDRFVPCDYDISLSFSDLNLYMYAMENNVISDPLDPHENVFLVCRAPTCKIIIDLSSDRFMPLYYQSRFSFSFSRPQIGVSLPTSHTIAPFATDRYLKAFEAEVLDIALNYTANYQIEGLHSTDTLHVEMETKNLICSLHGSVIRYIMVVRDNYGGLHTSFLTLDEYRRRLQDLVNGETKPVKLPPPPDSTYELHISWIADNVTLLLPSRLYDTKENCELVMAEMQLDARLTETYSDYQIDFCSLDLVDRSLCERHSLTRLSNCGSLFCDSATLRLHRLCGGSKSLCYVGEMELFVSSVSGDIMVPFLWHMLDWYRGFVFHFRDLDNSLPDVLAIANSLALSFKQFVFQSVEVTLWVGQDSLFQISLPASARVLMDNFADDLYTERTTIQFPLLSVTGLVLSVDQDFTLSTLGDLNWIEVLSFKTNGYCDLLTCDEFWESAMAEQRDFVKECDQSTRRCNLIFNESSRESHHIGGDEFFDNYSPPFVVDKMRKSFDRRSQLDMNFETAFGELSFNAEGVPSSISLSTDQLQMISSLNPGKSYTHLNRYKWRPASDASGGSSSFYLHKAVLASKKASFSSLNSTTVNEIPRIYGINATIDLASISCVVSPDSSNLVLQLLGNSAKTFNSAERALDTFQLKFMDSVVSAAEPIASFKVEIETVELSLICHSTDDAKRTAVSIIVLSCNDIIAYSASELDQNMTVGNMNCCLSVAGNRQQFTELDIDGAKPFQMQSSSAVLNVRVNFISIMESMGKSSRSLKFDHASTALCDHAIPAMFGIASDFILAFKRVRDELKRSLSQQWRLVQNVVLALSQFSNQENIGDATFISSPSNLWRIRAKKFQGSDDWKLLHHLRFCLKEFASAKGHELSFPALLPLIDAQETLKLVVSYLVNWRHWETGDLGANSLLCDLFAGPSLAPEQIPCNILTIVLANKLSITHIADGSTAFAIATDLSLRRTHQLNNSDVPCYTFDTTCSIFSFDVSFSPACVVFSVDLLSRIRQHTEDESAIDLSRSTIQLRINRIDCRFTAERLFAGFVIQKHALTIINDDLGIVISPLSSKQFTLPQPRLSVAQCSEKATISVGDTVVEFAEFSLERLSTFFVRDDALSSLDILSRHFTCAVLASSRKLYSFWIDWASHALADVRRFVDRTELSAREPVSGEYRKPLKVSLLLEKLSADVITGECLRTDFSAQNVLAEIYITSMPISLITASVETASLQIFVPDTDTSKVSLPLQRSAVRLLHHRKDRRYVIQNYIGPMSGAINPTVVDGFLKVVLQLVTDLREMTEIHSYRPKSKYAEKFHERMPHESSIFSCKTTFKSFDFNIALSGCLFSIAGADMDIITLNAPKEMEYRLIARELTAAFSYKGVKGLACSLDLEMLIRGMSEIFLNVDRVTIISGKAGPSYLTSFIACMSSFCAERTGVYTDIVSDIQSLNEADSITTSESQNIYPSKIKSFVKVILVCLVSSANLEEASESYLLVNFRGLEILKSAAEELRTILAETIIQLRAKFDVTGLQDYVINNDAEVNKCILGKVEIFQDPVIAKTIINMPQILLKVDPDILFFLSSLFWKPWPAHLGGLESGKRENSNESSKYCLRFPGGELILQNSSSARLLCARYPELGAYMEKSTDMSFALKIPSAECDIQMVTANRATTVLAICTIEALEMTCSPPSMSILFDFFKFYSYITSDIDKGELSLASDIHSNSDDELVFKIHVLARIKPSTIIFSCAPFNKVEAVATFDDSRVIYSSSSGDSQNIWAFNRQCEVALRHEYAPENCIGISIKNAETSIVTMIPFEKSFNAKVASISFDHNIRHLQDWILFQQAWQRVSGKRPSRKTVESESRGFRPRPRYMNFIVRNISVFLDLTQAIGDVTMSVNGTLIRAVNNLDYSSSLVRCQRFEALSSGRLHGKIAELECLRVIGLNSFVNGNRAAFVDFSIERALNMLQFNNEKIIVLEMRPVQLSLMDAGRNEDAMESLELQLSLAFGHVYGIFSKNSIPCFLRIQNRISTIIEEKNQVVRRKNLLSPETATASLHSKRSLEESFNFFVHDKVAIPIVSSFALEVRNIQLAFFKDQFSPTDDCVQIKMETLELELCREIEDNIKIRRETTLELRGRTTIRKCSKRIEKNLDQVADWTIAQWNDHVSARNFKVILEMPETSLLFVSYQRQMSKVVDYLLNSNFGGPIDVNLNFGFFKLLQEVASEFGDQMSASVKSLRDTLKLKQQMDAEERQPVVDPIVDNTGLTFRSIKPIILEPQLKIIDGATPNDVLRWLGIHKDSLPASIHTALTLNLEDVLKRVVAAYINWINEE